jgi:hypothetical protein
MHQHKLAAKPQSKYTPSHSPSYAYPSALDHCPRCRGLKKKNAKSCKRCYREKTRSTKDNQVYLIDGKPCRKIRLTRGAYAVVDKKDYQWLSRFNWHATGRPKQLYATTYTSDRKYVHMHTMILGSTKPDHANGNSLDNRRRNLRPATSAQNSYNRGKHGRSSRYIGVCRDIKRNKWIAQIKCAAKRVRLIKRFDNEIDAAKWRDKKAIEIFGEFARLNYP